jgi:hypothetical protein
MATPSPISDDEVRALLQRFACPLPFHIVRTRFLGNIASPDPLTSPMRAVEALWDGELPVFENAGDISDLMNGMVIGFWNRLSQHQDRFSPFRLMRIDVPATREGLTLLAKVRQEEIAGFITGLFGEHPSLDLPDRAEKAVGVLEDCGRIAAGTYEVVTDPDKPCESAGARTVIRQFRELTRVAEKEMHEIVLACARARGKRLQGMQAGNSTVH